MFNIIFYSVSEISQLSSGLSGLITWICTRRIGHSKDNFASRFSDAYRVKRVSRIIWTEPLWTDIGDRNKINESYLTSTFNVLAVAVKIKLFLLIIVIGRFCRYTRTCTNQAHVCHFIDLLLVDMKFQARSTFLNKQAQYEI